MAVTTTSTNVSTSAPVNEVQTITVDATDGTFTVSYGGQTTSALAYDVSAANMQTALRALSSINGANVSVSGTAPYTLTFSGTLAGTNVAQVTCDSTSLTGNTHTATPATTTPGSPRTSPQAISAPIKSDKNRGSDAWVYNSDGTDAVYLGGSDVTTTTGIKVAAGATLGPIDLAVDETLYAICSDSAAAVVNVLESHC